MMFRSEMLSKFRTVEPPFQGLFVLAAFLLFSKSCQASRPQEIILYSRPDFTGAQKSFFLKTTDLQKDSVGKIATSHCVVRGFWRIGGFLNSDPKLKFMDNTYGDERSGKVCGSWSNGNQTGSYLSVQPIGAPDLDAPALSLNKMTRFFSEQELYFEGRSLRLPEPVQFNSYGFTGSANWTVYGRTDYSGSSECLEVAQNPATGLVAAVSFNTNKSLLVGSILRGCGPTEGALISSRSEVDSHPPGVSPGNRLPTPGSRSRQNKRSEDKESGAGVVTGPSFISSLIAPLSLVGVFKVTLFMCG